MLQQLKKNKYQILCILLLVLLIISIGFQFSKGSNATCSIEEKTCIDTTTLKENKMHLQKQTYLITLILLIFPFITIYWKLT